MYCRRVSAREIAYQTADLLIMFDLVDYTVSKSGTLINAIDKIERNHSRTVIVVDCEKVVVLSEGDILRALLRIRCLRAFG